MQNSESRLKDVSDADTRRAEHIRWETKLKRAVEAEAAVKVMWP